MATEKQDLIKVATDIGIPLKGNESTQILKDMIQNYVPDITPSDVPDNQSTSPVQTPASESGERMIKASDVQKLIAEEMAKFREKEQEEKGVKKVKRVQEHHVQIHRWDAKWVVNFENINKDPYLKEPVFAYDVWNEQKRQNIANLNLILWDETTNETTTKQVELTRYIERRTSVYCLILKRHKIDATYSIGDVEIKKEGRDGMMVGTGVYRDQDVVMDKELFEVKIPTGQTIKVPDYAVC